MNSAIYILFKRVVTFNSKMSSKEDKTYSKRAVNIGSKIKHGLMFYKREEYTSTNIYYSKKKRYEEAWE
jgi:hypothetical protein